MAAGHINRVVGRLRRVALGSIDAMRSDAQLLEGFIARREPAAFELLLRRHGPMVLGVCRRLLGNEADAEDAFQATFLVLVRKAGSINPREQVGNWLYGVAYRTALKARTMNCRRRTRELQAGARRLGGGSDSGPAELWPELQAILDDELQRLPEKYRAAVVLCDLEGKTHREAARLLGWPDGTLTTRLIAARRLLAGRLTRRGLALSASAMAALMAENAAPAALPEALAATTVHGVAGTAAGAVSVKVAALTEGVLKAMLIAKLKTTAGVIVGLALLGAVAGGLAYPGPGTAGGAAQPNGNDPLAAVQPGGDPDAKKDAAAEPGRQGVVIQVDSLGLMQISLGTDDGVNVGDQLDVYRLKPQPKYVGRCKVTNAVARSCVAELRIPVKGIQATAGDHVTKELLQGALKPPPMGNAAGTEKPMPPPANVHGIVSRIDGANNLVEISLGSDDGIKENQVLHVHREAPKAIFVASIKIIVTFQRSAVARPTNPATLPQMNAGDKVSAALPLPPPSDSLPLKVDAGKTVGDSPRGDVRHVAERFLAGAVSGKIDDVRGLLQPSLPKKRVDALKGAVVKVPPMALVVVDTDEALAISEGCDRNVIEGQLQTRIVIALKRANSEQILIGWIAGDWLIADAYPCDGNWALNHLTDFLKRHPASQTR